MQHAEQLARFVSRRTVSSDVQDVVADTFLAAWRRFNELPPDPVPWLFVTARKLIANRHRSSQRRDALHTRIATQGLWVSGKQNGPELSEIDKGLLEAIDRLPEAEREAFMLIAWDGLDSTRAARAAGCSAATFRVRLHRARRRLNNQIVPPRPFVRLGDIQPSLKETR